MGDLIDFGTLKKPEATLAMINGRALRYLVAAADAALQSDELTRMAGGQSGLSPTSRLLLLVATREARTALGDEPDAGQTAEILASQDAPEGLTDTSGAMVPSEQVNDVEQ